MNKDEKTELEDTIIALYNALKGKPIPYEYEVPGINDALEKAQEIEWEREEEK